MVVHNSFHYPHIFLVMETNQGFDKQVECLQLSIFFNWKQWHTSKTLCPTLHDHVLPDDIREEQDCSHEHHG